MKKLSLAVALIVALGLLPSTTHANFFGNLFNRDREENENPFQNIFNNLLNNERERPEWTNPFGGDRPDNPLQGIWDLVCRNHVEETSNHEGGHLGGLIDKFREICGGGSEVDGFIDHIREKFEKIDICHRPKPPGGEIPEPSTYGIIGASALLGLVCFRRFRNKKTL